MLLAFPAFVTWTIRKPFRAYSKNTLTEIWPSYWPIRIGLRSLWKLHRQNAPSLVSADKTSPPVRDRSGAEYIGALRLWTFQFALKSPARTNACNQYARRQTRVSRIRFRIRAKSFLGRRNRETRLRIEFVAEIINYGGARSWSKGNGKGKSDVAGDDIRNWWRANQFLTSSGARSKLHASIVWIRFKLAGGWYISDRNYCKVVRHQRA